MITRTVKLAVQDVRKAFRIRGRRSTGMWSEVLGGITFDVHEGEIVSLIGESGCGKTTLARTVQGL